MSTYEPIASQTLGSAAASVTFSSIPQGYTDLVLVSRMGNSNAATGFGSGLTLNNDAVATGKLSFTILYGNGSAAGSFRWTTSTSGNVTVPLGIEATTLNAGGMSVMQLMNYSNSTTFKTILTRGGAAGSDTLTYVSLWQDKSPINKITIYPNDATNTILSGSTFSLYGIQVGDKAQKAQGGNIVTTDGTYVYHTFTSSGAFIPSQALTVDYLVVAGGGGAGDMSGGGAGGLRCTVTATGGGGSLESALSLSAGKSYPVIVGAGGSGVNAGATKGSSGSNSVFATITSTGGGYGGGYSTSTPAIADGGNGGSGGGSIGNTTGGTPGTGTANQGYGGTGKANATFGSGGGGGGAGGAAVGKGDGNGDYGGVGVATSISGSSVTYAGGGGGSAQSGYNQGLGGTGGGGNGRVQNGANATSGTANTGGGGGGSYHTNGLPSGNGGSGIVIIRYSA